MRDRGSPLLTIHLDGSVRGEVSEKKVFLKEGGPLHGSLQGKVSEKVVFKEG